MLVFSAFWRDPAADPTALGFLGLLTECFRVRGSWLGRFVRIIDACIFLQQI